MGKAITERTAISLLNNNLTRFFNIKLKDATKQQIFKALAMTAMNKMTDLRQKLSRSSQKENCKCVHYLCLEFLLGKTLKNTLQNLELEKVFSSALKNKGIDIEDLYDYESDAGLGSGGLGRLAACFMDSLATLNYPAVGHSILYEYGQFNQKIIDSTQTEVVDDWLPRGEFWLAPRQDKACTVRFGGTVTESYDNEGHMVPIYNDCTEVEAYPYDMMLSGYKSKSVSVLRLWSAKSKNTFDPKMFSQGQYAKALAESYEIESISKVLYPADDHIEGKSLRLKQQYFLTSAAMQNIISAQMRRHKELDSLPKYFSVHINDTHPTLAIPELMRILLDDYHYSWDKAWDITTQTFSFTNHTILAESLETWDEYLFQSLMPRIYSITKEIDRRLREEVKSKFGNNQRFIEKIAIISNRQIKMPNLAIRGSKKVNGVSKLHSEILKTTVFNDFYKLTPQKFTNVTNGVSHRRWLIMSNPGLDSLITSLIGKKYYKNADELKKLKQFTDDANVLKKLGEIKYQNKVDFAKYIYKEQGIVLDPNTRFDVHVKRIHEYKRQLLNVLKIIYLYSELKNNPDADITPQTFIFGGKAAPKYYLAKRIIKLINQLAIEINKDETINKKLKVVFIENYSISIAERLAPATDVSEQISLAGQEASGTGNMKAAMNGSPLICTLDGANIEIAEHCHNVGIFSFGLTASQVSEVWQNGYDPASYYNNNEKIKRVITLLNKGFNGESFDDISKYLLHTSTSKDPYMCLADFNSYLEAYNKMDKIYRNKKKWNKMCLSMISDMGYFSSDRSITEYVNNIWELTKIK